MDCKKLQQKIDDLYIEKGVKLDIKEKEHVNACAECRLYYAEATEAVSYTHLTLPTNVSMCRSRWAPDH